MNILLAACAATLFCLAGLAAAPNCTLSVSNDRPAVGEVVEFHGTTTPDNESYPAGGVEISRDNGTSWSGAIGVSQWHDLWSPPKRGPVRHPCARVGRGKHHQLHARNNRHHSTRAGKFAHRSPVRINAAHANSNSGSKRCGRNNYARTRRGRR